MRVNTADWVVVLLLAVGVQWACAPAAAHQKVVYGVHIGFGYGRTAPMDIFVDLNYYGTWIWVEPLGYCWRPFVHTRWRPYFYGHWVWSSSGWFWVSYEPFGWIVYHYGRWLYHPVYGWLWVPGYTWAPAWVEWVVIGDYIGWAPLPPPGWTLPNPVHVYDDDDVYEDDEYDHGYRPYRYGRYGPRYRPHTHANVWIYVSLNHFTRENVGIYARTPAIPRNHAHVMRRAPDVRLIERVARVSVPRVHIRTQTIRVRNRTIVRPQLPDTEMRRVQRYRPMIERKVIRKNGREHAGERRIRSRYRRPHRSEDGKNSTQRLPKHRKRPKYKRDH